MTIDHDSLSVGRQKRVPKAGTYGQKQRQALGFISDAGNRQHV